MGDVDLGLLPFLLRNKAMLIFIIKDACVLSLEVMSHPPDVTFCDITSGFINEKIGSPMWTLDH